MEVKPGYKMTEVGIIPEEWEISTIGREFSVQLGKMLDAERNVGVSKPYLGNKAVQWGRIDTSDLPTVPMSSSDLDKFRLKRGDLLVCEGGEVGRAAIWDAPLEECYYQKALHRLRPLHKFDPRLIVAILRQWSARGILVNYVTQTSIAHLPRDKFMEVPIPRPSLPEQNAIAEALGDADALLDGLDRLIAKKQNLKQAAMQELLTGRTRLPGFSGEWEVLSMTQSSTLKARIGWQGLTTAEYIDSGHYALITGTDFNDGKIDWYNCHFVEKERYDQDRNIQLQLNDVLLTKDGTIGKAAFVDHLTCPATLNSGVFVIRPKNGSYDPKFLFYVLKSQIFSDFLNKLQAGSTILHFYQKDFVNFEFYAPIPIEEQTAIAEVLSDMDAEIEALEARRAKTLSLKQGMMQELLTGRTRLV